MFFSFIEAIKHLLSVEDGEEFVRAQEKEYINPEFEISRFSDNMHRKFAYLTKTRKIDAF